MWLSYGSGNVFIEKPGTTPHRWKRRTRKEIPSMANKVGTLIKEARTDAGYTQEQLARKVKGVSASDISKAERGELELTQTALKEIAKATGVTQSSLIEAAKHSSYKGSASKSSSSGSKSSMQVTAAEKEIINLYRKADSETKKEVKRILKGTADDASEILEDVLGAAMEFLTKGR